MLVAVQIDHEIDQSPVQARQRSGQHGKTRTGKFRRQIKVKPASGQAGANIDVIADSKIELTRLSPATHFYVIFFALAIRHFVQRWIRHTQQQSLDLLMQGFRTGNFRSHLSINFGQRIGNSGLGFIHTDAGLDQITHFP